MKMNRRVLLAAIWIGVFAGCGEGTTGPGDDDVDDQEPNPLEDVIGSWAAARFEFVLASDTTERVDLVQLGGGFTLDVTDDGSFTALMTRPDTASGTIDSLQLGGLLERLGEDTLSVDFAQPINDEGFPDFRALFQVDASTMTWETDQPYEFVDADGDSIADPTHLTAVLDRE